MADNLSIARPYAKAVFAQAQATQQLAAWSKLLKVLAHIACDEQAAFLLKDPKVSNEQLSQLFIDVATSSIDSLSTELKLELKNLIALLSLDKRLIVLPDIEALYHQLLAEQEGRVEVQIFYAKKLDEETKRVLHQRLEKRFNSKVDIDYYHDESLIGGAVIKSADWVMDGSVKGKIAKLRDSLVN